MATISENQDAVPNPETTYRMSVGDTFEGTLSTYEDIDWIGIELTGGTSGTISLSFPGTTPRLPVMGLTLYDANEGVVANFIVLNSGQAPNGELLFTLSDNSFGGLYYIGIAGPVGFGVLGASYKVTVTATELTAPAPSVELLSQVRMGTT